MTDSTNVTSFVANGLALSQSSNPATPRDLSEGSLRSLKASVGHSVPVACSA